MSTYLGDFRIGKTIRKMWNSNAIAGESITRATNGTISVYKDGGVTQSTTGVTDTEDFDGLTGVHLVAIDTSADGTFYSAGSEFEVVLSAATIDGKTINATLFSFSLENRSALMPTTDGRKLDVSAGGEAGIDWANIGSPSTTQGLSGTTVKTATDVETDTADIQSRLPATLVSGRMDASVGAMANNVMTAAAAAADLATELQSGLATASALSTVEGKIDTLDVVADAILLDTAEIGAAGSGLSAIPWNAAWDAEVQSEVADALGVYDPPTKAELDAAVSPLALEATLAIVDGIVDAIKLKTDGLPSDPADASDIAGAFSTVNSTLATIAAFVDTEIAAIKNKTDLIPNSPAAVGDAMTLTSAYDFAKGSVAMAEAYAANGAAPSPIQALYAIHQMLMQFSIAGTNITVKKLNNSTTAFVVSLDDSASPTEAART